MLLESKSSAKRLAFTIENLAKSSCPTESDVGDRLADINLITSSGSPSVENRTSSPSSDKWTSPNMGIRPLSNFHGLSPETDLGYKSLQPSPFKSGSGQKRKRMESDEDTSEIESSPESDRGRFTGSENSFGSISPTPSDDECDSKRKKARTAFSSDQVELLEERYMKQRYLPASERSQVAKKLKLTDQQVKTWFQNRRMKEKRQQKDDEHSRNYYLPTGGVDVSQLQALGIPCPPPYRIGTTHMPGTPGNTSSPYSFLGHSVSSPMTMFPGFLNDNRMPVSPYGFAPLNFSPGYSPIMPSFQTHPRPVPVHESISDHNAVLANRSSGSVSPC